MNIGMLLEMVADGAPERIVVGSRASGLSAFTLLARARRAAGWLRSHDVEHVVFVDVNSDAVPLALFGAGLAGIPFAPLNYRLTDEELNALLRRVVPAVVIAGRDIVPRLDVADGSTIVPADEFVAVAGDDGGDALADDELPFVDPDDVAVLLFTSGTTGEPKAALLRHRHLASYIIGSVEYLDAGDDEAQLVSVPPYHVAGVSSVLSATYGGRRICYLDTFEPGAWVAAVDAEQITQAMVVPTMLGRILDTIDATGTKLSTLRHLSYGGGRMPIEVIERAMTMLPGVDFVNAYGLTETSSTIAVLTPDDHRDAFASDDPLVRRRLRSVGRPLPSVEVQVRNGEIFVRGEQVAGEYVGRTVLDGDGWLPTNDAGFVDDDGFLFIDGRLDDVIVRGAENLSPVEIEDVLRAHPAVVDAAVVGIPDAEWGEAVAAAVVPAPGALPSDDELKQWVKDRLRSTRTPVLIEFRTELPYNDTGKLLRRVIRAELRTNRAPAPS